jgi:hypothetical protein
VISFNIRKHIQVVHHSSQHERPTIGKDITPLPHLHHPQPKKYQQPLIATTKSTCTYNIGCLLFFITLLISGGFGLVRQALLLGESLPTLTKNLADLT